MDRLTAAEVNKKFIYFNVGTPNRPVNPAVAKILRGSRMRAYMRSIGTEAQILFSATAVKGKRPNPQRNSRLVRSRTHLGAVAGKNGLLGPPDRWVTTVEAYARHSRAREFGYVPGGKFKGWTPERIAAYREKHGGPGELKRFGKYKRKPWTSIKRRQLPEAPLGGRLSSKSHREDSVVATINRIYYRKRGMD
ncbi:hypothetical protein GS982_01320 [Rhodococcus hoagii]|uniref:Phage protein n=1 Tax=Rhodococcus hoagii TaxID=43767 RepID=A0A9Q4ZIM3_RHOHA|nr:hypothetical protein [Prescottella equi]NKT77247.1 hypothetical protein [Prescottella equi]NKZ81032.1 hypothetical protein [Prescottella equi]